MSLHFGISSILRENYLLLVAPKSLIPVDLEVEEAQQVLSYVLLSEQLVVVDAFSRGE